MELGTNIWRARKQLQLSQEQLGAMVGVTRQTISNWELNETVPDAKQLLALSKALKVSLDALGTAAMELLYDLHINVWIARAAGAIVAGMLGLLLQHILPHEKRAAD